MEYQQSGGFEKKEGKPCESYSFGMEKRRVWGWKNSFLSKDMDSSRRIPNGKSSSRK